MSQPSEPNKRIVSKAEYVVMISEKVSRLLSGRLLIIAVWIGMIGTFIGFLSFMVMMGDQNIFPPVIRGGIFLLVGVGCWFFCTLLMCFQKIGQNQIEDAKAMEEILPFTRANTGDLHTSNSLLRASSQPSQEYEAVLLRPATKSQQTPAEQLLRPVDE